MRLSLGSCSLERNVLALILAMHQEATLRSYQNQKGLNKRKSIPTHSKFIVRHDPIWYFDHVTPVSCVSDDYVRQAHASISTLHIDMDLLESW